MKEIELEDGHVLEVTEHERMDRDEYDNLGIILSFHGEYDFTSPNAPRIDHRDFGGWGEVKAELENEYGAVHVKTLWLYDHGGLALSTRSFYGRAHQAEWDSGRVGFVYTTAERIKAMGTPEGRIDAVLDAEIDTYSKYVNGQPYFWAEVRNSEGVVVGEMEFDHENEAEPWARELIKARKEFASLVTVEAD